MDKTAQKTRFGESVRQKLKNLSRQRNRPFDEFFVTMQWSGSYID